MRSPTVANSCVWALTKRYKSCIGHMDTGSYPRRDLTERTATHAGGFVIVTRS